MNNRRQKEAITIVRNTSKGIIPSQESTKQSKESTGLYQLFIWHSIHIEKVSKGEQEKGKVDKEKEGEERDGGFEGEHSDQRSEDEPPLKKKQVSFLSPSFRSTRNKEQHTKRYSANEL